MGFDVHQDDRREREFAFDLVCHVWFGFFTQFYFSNPPTDARTEFADVTDQILDKHGLAKILSDPAVLPYFRSLSITDQPRARPPLPLAPADREKHIILTLAAPSPAHAADTVSLVDALFPFIDSLTKTSLRPETRLKLKKTREEVDKLIKEDNEKYDKEDVCVSVIIPFAEPLC